ncbi:hypothetical protein SETIT_2G066300v2 [Setaria italica]|uniref:Uncharacterized protein n=1 Tax=Setaria italica TaxID=4555 RepID=A0A368PWB4_SETIT|nr:hypothetical protein SETIT_2G066300v2 [Setaria italica]
MPGPTAGCGTHARRAAGSGTHTPSRSPLQGSTFSWARRWMVARVAAGGGRGGRWAAARGRGGGTLGGVMLRSWIWCSGACGHDQPARCARRWKTSPRPAPGSLVALRRLGLLLATRDPNPFPYPSLPFLSPSFHPTSAWACSGRSSWMARG